MFRIWNKEANFPAGREKRVEGKEQPPNPKKEGAEPMLWKHERRLVFSVSENWKGWLCERCCWNRSQPDTSEGRSRLARSIQADFDAHDCEEFALQHWRLQQPCARH